MRHDAARVGGDIAVIAVAHRASAHQTVLFIVAGVDIVMRSVAGGYAPCQSSWSLIVKRSQTRKR